MAMKLCGAVLLIVIGYSKAVTSENAESFICEDYTFCWRVKCAAPPDPCPKDKPYLLPGKCGCCDYCSETPRVGPCGTCGKDVVCREKDPICTKENQTVTLDYCGCCKTCKSILESGQECEKEGPNFSICAVGHRCINGICTNFQ